MDLSRAGKFDALAFVDSPILSILFSLSKKQRYPSSRRAFPCIIARSCA